ncbi:hypothetical protein [Microbispora hainanensis]|uniref:Uncharacterized protein n=1 Tax=Microbispora hainanensis TaxID=568844 RepID=A0A544Y4R1_9ACTN|nr:hypothetical protein [Microbispora hainanensis]TQS11721.1 hypothetical protein FLX08_36895 [Microbispora hainanensis]
MTPIYKPLNGLAEKMEQIARTIPDPPLTILTEAIPSDADPTRGYLVVHIPASPAAPHGRREVLRPGRQNQDRPVRR